ncbi:MAG: peptide chain release factor N(5)-glutamine methyltransferase [Candidatus Omnitrophota bacterium]
MKTAYFMDFELDTGGGAFFPRPETELLVEKAVELLSDLEEDGTPRRILDIGTGSGNIAISLTKYMPSSRIVALDISESALRSAIANAVKYGCENRIDFIRSDLFCNVNSRYKGFFDLVVSNPPYVGLRDFDSLSSEVKQDPYIALFGGKDGLDIYKKLVKEAPSFMKLGARLILEIGYDQGQAVAELLSGTGSFTDIALNKDYSGIDRIISARKI